MCTSGAIALKISTDWSLNEATITSSVRPWARRSFATAASSRPVIATVGFSSMLSRVVGKASSSSSSVGTVKSFAVKRAGGRLSPVATPRHVKSDAGRLASCTVPSSSMNQYAASSRLISASVICSTDPVPFVVRSTVSSCRTTTRPSAVRWTSVSIMSAPLRFAVLKAYSVSLGASISPPWWAMLSGVRASQGLSASCADAAPGATSAPVSTSNPTRPLNPMPASKLA